MSNATPHPVKGGIAVTSYMTYNCLRDDDDGGGVLVGGDHLREFWQCPTCDVHMPMTVSERVRHQSVCAMTSLKQVCDKSVFNVVFKKKLFVSFFLNFHFCFF